MRRIATGLASLDGALLPVLHEVNDGLGWVSDEDVAVVADVLNLSRAEVHGVLTFYSDFRRSPAPTHRVALCRGEACQALGSEPLHSHAVAALAGRPDVELGEVFCLGNCALGPSALVDGRLRGRLTPDALVAAVDEAPAAATALQPSATGQGEPVTVYIPADASARAVGADAVAAAFSADPSVTVVRTGSRGMLWLEPLVEVQTAAGRRGYANVAASAVPSILAGTAESVGVLDADPWLAGQRRVTFARVGVVDPMSLADYRSRGGMAGLARALTLPSAEVVEEVVASGLEAAKSFIKVLCEAQATLAQTSSKPIAEFPRFLDYQEDVYAAVEAASLDEVTATMSIAGKQEREDRVEQLKESLKADLAGAGKPFEGREKEVSAAYRSVQKKVVRQRILRDGVRIDGRGLRDIRALSAEVEVIPRVHGSAIFERGETQIMGVTTLNMLKMEQQLDTLSPQSKKRYMHNYNFPPYSTGETGRVGSPKRREIGHGALAERALLPVLPTREEFPYAIRQVSEALGSNGSTSMGSVCASTLSLLNAGVPLRAPVAGIAMGLVSDTVDGQTRYAALTDILGAEDAFGDMDFKVAGTKEFVTAIQLDTKLDGIPADVLAAALTQAREARLHILDVMAEAIDAPDEMSAYAPRIITIKVPVDKIGEVIGPKGKMINQIQDDTGADISIEDDGTVYIGAVDGPSAEAARAAVNAIANPTMPEIGERYMGTVVKTTTFGAFISLVPGKDGLLHISQIRKMVGGKRVENVEDVLGVGQKVQVEIAEIDPRGKLSLVPVLAEAEQAAADAADAADAAKGAPAEANA